MIIDVNQTVATILVIIAGLGTLLGFLKLLMEVVLKPLNAYKEAIKRKTDAISHQPMVDQIESLKEQIEDLAESNKVTQRKAEMHNKVTIYTARALITLVTDLSIKGEPNGQTKKDIENLREYIYKAGNLD